MKIYVTYGCGSNLPNCYSEVFCENYGQGRAHVDAVTRGKFAFTYTEEDFVGQVEKYGLHLVPLQAQVLAP